MIILCNRDESQTPLLTFRNLMYGQPLGPSEIFQSLQNGSAEVENSSDSLKGKEVNIRNYLEMAFQVMFYLILLNYKNLISVIFILEQTKGLYPKHPPACLKFQG